jgi:hypothetical protein
MMTLAPHGPQAEALQVFQAPKVGEPLAAPVQLKQATFLEHALLQLPNSLGPNGRVPDEAQTEGALGLVPGQAGGGVQHGLQVIAFGQFAVFGSDAAGDLFELLSAGKLMLNHYHELLQFDWHLD